MTGWAVCKCIYEYSLTFGFSAVLRDRYSSGCMLEYRVRACPRNSACAYELRKTQDCRPQPSSGKMSRRCVHSPTGTAVLVCRGQSKQRARSSRVFVITSEVSQWILQSALLI